MQTCVFEWFMAFFFRNRDSDSGSSSRLDILLMLMRKQSDPCVSDLDRSTGNCFFWVIIAARI